MKQGAKKAWNDCKKFPRAGRFAGISRLGRKLSPGFKDKPLSCMEVDCTVHNRRQGQSCAFAFSAAKKSSPNVNPFAFRLHSRETFRAAALGYTIHFLRCAHDGNVTLTKNRRFSSEFSSVT